MAVVNIREIRAVAIATGVEVPVFFIITVFIKFMGVSVMFSSVYKSIVIVFTSLGNMRIVTMARVIVIIAARSI
jgi:hypothetical protein